MLRGRGEEPSVLQLIRFCYQDIKEGDTAITCQCNHLTCVKIQPFTDCPLWMQYKGELMRYDEYGHRQYKSEKNDPKWDIKHILKHGKEI